MKEQKKETRTIVCPICGVTFETRHPRKKYCSKQCLKKAVCENNRKRYIPMSEDEKMRLLEKRMKHFEISPPREECFACPYPDCTYEEKDCPVLRKKRRRKKAAE